MHYASWFLSIRDRSLSEIHTIKGESQISFCTSSTMRYYWAQLFQESRYKLLHIMPRLLHGSCSLEWSNDSRSSFEFMYMQENLMLISEYVAGLSYSPTSTIFINVPCISKLQWHPFTIISNSNLEPERLSVLINCEGNWTKKLYDVISSPPSIDRHLQVSVEGPYGPSATHFLRFKRHIN